MWEEIDKWLLPVGIVIGAVGLWWILDYVEKRVREEEDE